MDLFLPNCKVEKYYRQFFIVTIVPFTLCKRSDNFARDLYNNARQQRRLKKKRDNSRRKFHHISMILLFTITAAPRARLWTHEAALSSNCPHEKEERLSPTTVVWRAEKEKKKRKVSTAPSVPFVPLSLMKTGSWQTIIRHAINPT